MRKAAIWGKLTLKNRCKRIMKLTFRRARFKSTEMCLRQKVILYVTCSLSGDNSHSLQVFDWRGLEALMSLAINELITIVASMQGFLGPVAHLAPPQGKQRRREGIKCLPYFKTVQKCQVLTLHNRALHV